MTPDTTDKKILPCPFCGGESFAWVQGKSRELHGHFVRCDKCGAQSRGGSDKWPLSETEEDAIQLWNARVPEHLPDSTAENKPQTITLQYTPGAQDWDDTGENANYMNLCSLCKWMFWGHKHRVVCRTCAEKAAKESDPTPGHCPACGASKRSHNYYQDSDSDGNPIGEKKLCEDGWHYHTTSDAATPAPEPWRPKVGDKVKWANFDGPMRDCPVETLVHNPRPFVWQTKDECGVMRFREQAELVPYVWTMPTAPAGHEWHRVDGWQQDMLPPGWRPLCKGEPCWLGDQVFVNGVWTGGIDTGFPMSSQHLHTRTTRPTPSPAQAEPTAQTGKTVDQMIEEMPGSKEFKDFWYLNRRTTMTTTGDLDVQYRIALEAWQAAIVLASQQPKKVCASTGVEPLPDGKNANVGVTVHCGCGVWTADVKVGLAQSSRMEPEKINTRCPACNSQTLMIGSGGLLVCSLIGCPDPALINELWKQSPSRMEEQTAEIASLKSQLHESHEDNAALNTLLNRTKAEMAAHRSEVIAKREEVLELKKHTEEAGKVEMPSVEELEKEVLSATWPELVVIPPLTLRTIISTVKDACAAASYQACANADRLAREQDAATIADLRRENASIATEKEQAINREAEAIGALTRMKETNKGNYATYDEAMKRLEPLPTPPPSPEEGERVAIEKEHEEFEAMATREWEVVDLRRDHKGYLSSSIRMAWIAWQAARKPKGQP